MPCPSKLRSAPLCLCETTPFHAFAQQLLAMPSPDLPCATSPWPSSALLFHALATPCRALPCLRITSLCITLHSPCSALRCGSPALHRCSMLCRRYSSLRLASPRQFIAVQCHSNSIQPNAIAKRLFANQCPRCAVPFTAKPLRYTAIRAAAYSTISYRKRPQEAFLHWPRPFNCP